MVLEVYTFALHYSVALWSDVLRWHVSICMVVYHQMDFSQGNHTNANTIGSISPPPPPSQEPLRAELSAMAAF